MSRTRRARALALLLLPIALVACLAGKKISDIDAPSSAAATASDVLWALPSGVVVSSARRGMRLVDGLYPSVDPAERCCWIAPSATVVAAKSGPASVAILTVLVPDYPFFDAHPQGLGISVAGSAAHFTALGPGVHRLRVDLPALRPNSPDVAFALRTDETFVPANEHVNADHRALGLILLGITLDAVR